MQIAGAAVCESFVRLPDRPVRRPVLATRIAPVRIKSGPRDQTIPAYEMDPGGGLFPASSAGNHTDPGRISLARNRYRPDSLRWIALRADRKSTRLNSSHMSISYAVFCLKKKNIIL